MANHVFGAASTSSALPSARALIHDIEDSDVVSEADTIPDAVAVAAADELNISDSEETVPDAGDAELPPLPPPSVSPPAPALPVTPMPGTGAPGPAPAGPPPHDMNSLSSIARPGMKPGLPCDSCQEGEGVFRPGLYGRLFLGCTRYHADGCQGRAVGWRGVDFVLKPQPLNGPVAQMVSTTTSIISSAATPGSSLDATPASAPPAPLQQQVVVATPQDLQRDLLRGMAPAASAMAPPVADSPIIELDLNWLLRESLVKATLVKREDWPKLAALLQQRDIFKLAKLTNLEIRELEKKNKKQLAEPNLETTLLAQEAVRCASRGLPSSIALARLPDNTSSQASQESGPSREEVVDEAVNKLLRDKGLPLHYFRFVKAELEHRMKCRTCCSGKGVHDDLCSHAGNFINRTRKPDRKLWGEFKCFAQTQLEHKQQSARHFLAQYDKYSGLLQSTNDGSKRARRVLQNELASRSFREARQDVRALASSTEHLAFVHTLQAMLASMSGQHTA